MVPSPCKLDIINIWRYKIPFLSLIADVGSKEASEENGYFVRLKVELSNALNSFKAWLWCPEKIG